MSIMTFGVWLLASKSWDITCHTFTSHMSSDSVYSLINSIHLFAVCTAYATWLGLSASDGSALISVASTANIVGRVLAGQAFEPRWAMYYRVVWIVFRLYSILADRIGHLTTNMLFCFFCGLSSFLIWTFADSYGTLMAFSAVFGMMAASYSPLSKLLQLSINYQAVC